jgi:hypothetical protein
MPGLDPGIHAVTARQVEAQMEWIAGSSPAMTSSFSSAAYSSGRATRKPMTLSRLPLGKLIRAEGRANSAS